MIHKVKSTLGFCTPPGVVQSLYCRLDSERHSTVSGRGGGEQSHLLTAGLYLQVRDSFVALRDIRNLRPTR